MISGNTALILYAGLTQGAIAAIIAHGTDEEKARYPAQARAGVWTGTMNLTESHAGSDVGMLRTKAVPASSRGISLFIVSKFLSDGTPNGVSCGAIEEKTGIQSNSTWPMDYDEATGWLLAEANPG